MTRRILASLVRCLAFGAGMLAGWFLGEWVKDVTEPLMLLPALACFVACLFLCIFSEFVDETRR